MNMSEDIKALVDGELDEARAAELTRAMAESPELLAEFHTVQSLTQQVRLVAASYEPVGYDSAVAKVKRRPRLTWPLRFAMVAPLLIVAVFALNRSGPRFASEMAEPATMVPASVTDGSNVFKNKAPAGLDADVNAKESSPSEAPLQGERAKAEAEAQEFSSERQIIRSGSLDVRVVSVRDSQTEVERLTAGLGGFVANTSTSIDREKNPSVFMTLRIPEKDFELAISKLRALGEEVPGSFSSSSDDATAQVADVEARLKVMRAEEESYVTMLRAAKKVGELLEIKERLSAVRQGIESLDAQRKSLRGQAAFSTISLTLIQRPGKSQQAGPSSWAEDTWASAVSGLKGVGTWLGQAAIIVFVYSPVWLPAILILYWVGRKRKPE